MNKDVLSSFLSLVLDYRGKTPKKLNSDWVNNGYRAISALNVKTSGLVNLESVRCVDKETYSKWMKNEVKKGDILLTSEAPSGEVMIWNSDEKIVLSQRVFGLRVNERINNRYLKYYLQSDLGQKEILNKTSGSTVSGISAKMFDLINVYYPSLERQEKIGNLLFEIDLKIELNNKINAELEAMAKLIYNYWFVQFDFPDENGKPYKSSGGKMIFDKELKREIPAGWVVHKLSEIIELGNDQLNPSENPNKTYKHLSIPAFDDYGGYVIEKGNEIGSNKFIVKEFDILVSKLNPWFNRVYYALNEDDLICTTEMVVWRNDNLFSKNFFYFLARSERFIKFCTQSATGTSNSHKRVNPDIMMGYKLVYQSDLSNKYGSIVDPWIKQCVLNREENRKLTELRNWLLPILINGQLNVA